jgi:hypothetical protein
MTPQFEIEMESLLNQATARQPSIFANSAETTL